MSALIPGLPDLVQLRQTIVDTLTPANLLGLYEIPEDEPDWAIAVEGLGYDEGEQYPPPGTTVSGGLEVVIVPAEDIPPVKPLLDGDMVTFRHAIVLKEHDQTAQGRTLRAFNLLKRVLGSTDSSVIRLLPNNQLGNLETLTFSLEEIVYIPADD